jgi:hypothetical protein
MGISKSFMTAGAAFVNVPKTRRLKTSGRRERGGTVASWKCRVTDNKK